MRLGVEESAVSILDEKEIEQDRIEILPLVKSILSVNNQI